MSEAAAAAPCRSAGACSWRGAELTERGIRQRSGNIWRPAGRRQGSVAPPRCVMAHQRPARAAPRQFIAGARENALTELRRRSGGSGVMKHAASAADGLSSCGSVPPASSSRGLSSRERDSLRQNADWNWTVLCRHASEEPQCPEAGCRVTPRRPTIRSDALDVAVIGRFELSYQPLI